MEAGGEVTDDVADPPNGAGSVADVGLVEARLEGVIEVRGRLGAADVIGVGLEGREVAVLVGEGLSSRAAVSVLDEGAGPERVGFVGAGAGFAVDVDPFTFAGGPKPLTDDAN